MKDYFLNLGKLTLEDALITEFKNFASTIPESDMVRFAEGFFAYWKLYQTRPDLAQQVVDLFEYPVCLEDVKMHCLYANHDLQKHRDQGRLASLNFKIHDQDSETLWSDPDTDQIVAHHDYRSNEMYLLNVSMPHQIKNPLNSENRWTVTVAFHVDYQVLVDCHLAGKLLKSSLPSSSLP